jgi:hypothetical protein
MCTILSVTDKPASKKLYANHAILWTDEKGPRIVYGTRPYLITFLIDQLGCDFNQARLAYKECAIR